MKPSTPGTDEPSRPLPQTFAASDHLDWRHPWFADYYTIDYLLWSKHQTQDLSPLLPLPSLPHHPFSHHSACPDDTDGTQGSARAADWGEEGSRQVTGVLAGLLPSLEPW